MEDVADKSESLKSDDALKVLLFAIEKINGTPNFDAAYKKFIQETVSIYSAQERYGEAAEILEKIKFDDNDANVKNIVDRITIWQ